MKKVLSIPPRDQREAISDVAGPLASLVNASIHTALADSTMGGGVDAPAMTPFPFPAFCVSGSMPVATLQRWWLKGRVNGRMVRVIVNCAGGSVPRPTVDDSSIETHHGVTWAPEIVDLILDQHASSSCFAVMNAYEDRLAADLGTDLGTIHIQGTASTSGASVAVRVPLYYVALNLQDNGSQRLEHVLTPLAAFFDGVAAHRHLEENSACLQALLSSSSKVVPGVEGSYVRLSNAVLVHCMQGVSRSVSAIMWFTLWRWFQAVDDNDGTMSSLSLGLVSFPSVLDAVRKGRPCATPNLCFAAEMRSAERRWMTTAVNALKSKKQHVGAAE